MPGSVPSDRVLLVCLLPLVVLLLSGQVAGCNVYRAVRWKVLSTCWQRCLRWSQLATRNCDKNTAVDTTQPTQHNLLTRQHTAKQPENPLLSAHAQEISVVASLPWLPGRAYGQPSTWNEASPSKFNLPTTEILFDDAFPFLSSLHKLLWTAQTGLAWSNRVCTDLVVLGMLVGSRHRAAGLQERK